MELVGTRKTVYVALRTLLAFVLGSLVDALQRKVVPKGIRRGGSAA